MKKNRIILSLLAVAAVGPLGAAPLTPDQALGRLEDSPMRKVKGDSQAPRLLTTFNDGAGEAAIYLFTYTGDAGFMLLSADDATPALLGYSADNNFAGADDMSADMKWWIKIYSSQIENARGAAPYRETRTRAGEWPVIEPLLTTTWDQGSPYNNQCPRDASNRRCVTGCVATAMAQVMNYWEYPARGQGSIVYSPTTLDRDLSLDFSTITFDWENMKDSYKDSNTSAQITAVAALMKACGYSVKMRYTASESGAHTADVATALKTYFGYDKGVSVKERSLYKQDAWEQMVYDELKTVGPVIYSGQSSEGGHCFVCDGYDGKGFFHINWGWSGLSDGYFLLNELTPGSLGIGGHYGGFNISQQIISGVMPPVGRLSLIGDLSIDNKADDSGNTSGWGYTYRINDFSNILLSMRIRVSGGEVHSPLYVSVYETDPVTLQQGNAVYDVAERLNAQEGVTDYSTVVRMQNYDVSKLYTLTVAYELKGERTFIGSLRFAAGSGVDDVADYGAALAILSDGKRLAAEGEGPISLRLYDLGGSLIGESSGETPSISLVGVPAGVYVARAVTSSGVTKVKKLLLK